MSLKRNLPYGLLVVGAAAWLGVVFLAPYARSQGWGIAPWLYALYAPICHQIPERSFVCFTEPLAVGHRCTGLYSGFLAGLLAWPFLHRWRVWLLDRPRWILLFFAPMAVDVFLVSNTALTRFATGFTAAFPVALLAWVAACQIFASRSPVPTQPAMEES